ncbi:MAG: M20 family metallopeptidase [Lachnospiraceae bacterium]|nr:M20 family metallopeptidase [Lachnospiraceae bacterium]
MNAKDYFRPSDEERIKDLRHRIHMYPELELDLPKTVAVVTGELERIGIPYTEKFCRSSVVGYINYGDEALTDVPAVGEEGHVFTIGLRADMDALPIQEETGLPYASKIPGVMHACGHDTHTAMLLGAAQALKRAEEAGVLKCRVKLLFQPNEEGEGEGSVTMIENGVLSDVDEIYGQHMTNKHPTGTMCWHKGPTMAGCHTYNVDFYGKSAHATLPQYAHDALAMALRASEGIYFLGAREISPFEEHIISIGYLHAGSTHNIIADHAEMKVSTRYFNDELGEFIGKRIRKICEDAAAELGGTVRVEIGASTYAVNNDPQVTEKAIMAAEKIVSREKVMDFGKEMGSEDFSCFEKVRPGTFWHIGTGNPEKGCTGVAHQCDLVIDEDAFITGSMIMTQVALDQ